MIELKPCPFCGDEVEIFPMRCGTGEQTMREMATIFMGELVKRIAILLMVYVFIKVRGGEDD